MNNPLEKIHIQVEYFTGQDEDDVGYPYYVATCTEIAAVTDGRTLDELYTNIREMIAAHIEDEDTVALYNLVANPTLLYINKFAN